MRVFARDTQGQKECASFINVQTGILMYDVSFDVVGHALTATTGPAAWFDRDTGL